MHSPPCSTEINENEMEKNGNRNGKMILAAERVGWDGRDGSDSQIECMQPYLCLDAKFAHSA